MNTTAPTSEDDLLSRFAALVSPDTMAAVANVIEYTIEREYGADNATEARGAWVLAVAGIRMDWHAYWTEVNGPARGLEQAADMHLRTLVRQGLEARRCPCTKGGPGHDHSDGLRCPGHTEADVPPTEDGLCGGCHVAEWHERHAAQG